MSVREAGGGQSIPGGGVGGAPPPGNGFARGKVPHFVPLCNTEPALRPTSPHVRCRACGEGGDLQRLRGGTVFMQVERRPACDAAARAIAGRLAVSGRVLAPWGTKWEELPSACRERGDQRGGDQQQDRRDEQQRDDELDLGRGLGRLLRALGGTPGARLDRERGERGGKWGAVALGPFEGGDERRGERGARLQLRQRGQRGLPHVRPAGRALELSGQQPGVALADL